MLRFRSFRRELLVLLLALTGGAELLAFIIVWRIHRADAHREIGRQLEVASAHFARLVEQRTNDLTRGTKALSHDVGARETLSSTEDRETLRSVLISFRGRVDAAFVALLSLEGALLAETRAGASAAEVYRALQAAADISDTAQATGYGAIDDVLYSITIVPLRAPDIVAWVAAGFPLDRAFVAELKAATGVDVTLRHAGKVFATTSDTAGDFVSRTLELRTASGPPATMTLQYSLEEKLAPARRLERVLAAVFAGSLALAALLALAAARNVSTPVQQLAAHTRRIAAGDYAARVTLDRADELGQLADAFNAMSAGLEERDRIRDLLDKNVSPEVAARLLRDGAALGGQEREVTILFADLRGFTSLAEQFAPRDLLTLLNRYLDRMGAEIERHGGVIDKFIGDAVMALFGAPVDQGDAADRALAAAVAMQRALEIFNVELVREGHAPLWLGVGVNTARVVAGNIGSHRRLNYSVIGDGVNVAARLQALTRTPEYRANIITTAATIAALHDVSPFALRPLGRVQVKGRAETVDIFAAGPVEATESPAPAAAMASPAREKPGANS